MPGEKASLWHRSTEFSFEQSFHISKYIIAGTKTRPGQGVNYVLWENCINFRTCKWGETEFFVGKLLNFTFSCQSPFCECLLTAGFVCLGLKSVMLESDHQWSGTEKELCTEWDYVFCVTELAHMIRPCCLVFPIKFVITTLSYCCNGLARGVSFSSWTDKDTIRFKTRQDCTRWNTLCVNRKH